MGCICPNRFLTMDVQVCTISLCSNQKFGKANVCTISLCSNQKSGKAKSDIFRECQIPVDLAVEHNEYMTSGSEIVAACFAGSCSDSISGCLTLFFLHSGPKMLLLVSTISLFRMYDN